MIARRLTLATVASLCALACLLAAGAGSVWAGGSFQFGPPGEEAGQISNKGGPSGMAVDNATGDVYVSDGYNERIDKFDQSGEFLLAWGWGAADGAEELQTCTTSCRQGREGSGVKSFCQPAGATVDNDVLSGSYGDVYMVNFCANDVEKFDSSGKFLLMFGGHVNETTGANVCVAGEACQGGTQGVGDGEFTPLYGRSYMAAGPGGAVYVGDKARVQIFEPSGAWRENISLSALSSEGQVSALAVNAAGDVFVKDEGVPGVREFEPGGVEVPTQFDEGSEVVESITLNAAGDVFISENKVRPFESTPCKCDFLEYSPSGQQLKSFGGQRLVSMRSAMVFDDALEELLVYGADEGSLAYGHFGVWAFTLPAPGPLVEPGSEKAAPELRGHAALEAVVNPEGNETTYHFEYVDEADFQASGYASASSTTPASAGSTFNDQPVSASLASLVPGTRYHWRVVATNSQGTVMGPDQIVESTPSALIEGPWAANVTSMSVTFGAQIDPLGADTSYRLEYGTSASYGHVLSGSVGEGMSYVQVAYHRQELEPDTTYHYRVVTSSEVGTVEGADRTFTTQLAGGALALPDGRGWELVSPTNKSGALIEDIEMAQAASDGSGIAYAASQPLGEGIVGHVGQAIQPNASATILSKRGAGGWRTRDISPKQSLPPEGVAVGPELLDTAEAFHVFSPDLSLAALEPRFMATAQSGEATEPTLYLRNNVSETYQPLVTAGNVPPGTRFGPGQDKPGEGQMGFVAATPDLSHVVFITPASLTPEASSGGGGGGSASGTPQNLYEWSGGRLQLANILPSGESIPGAKLGSTKPEDPDTGMTAHAISSDGRWIVFNRSRGLESRSYYVRDMVDKTTVAFGRDNGNATFETMNSDGSKVFYLEPDSGAIEGEAEEEGELYVFDPVTGVKMDLTANHLDGEHSARVQDTLVGASEDGSYVYFVARGVLASGAAKGKNNLYLLHDNGGQWTTTFIAMLSGEDEKGWRPYGHNTILQFVNSRVSPDGRYVAFMSDMPVTGYDNHDAVSGQPDEEVYLYSATANRLVCASCNPSGARPVGLHDGSSPSAFLMDENEAWTGGDESRNGGRGHWLASIVPPAWHVSWKVASYQPRSLSDSGRLFFDSSDALVPQDTNGLADVYEYEPVGVGSCGDANTTFSERADGCVSLISSGQSALESTFFDASENGDDVFFITASRLTSEDYDTAYDVYDAHVCTVAAPCRAGSVLPLPCTSGDSCKAAPSPQPEIFGPAPSATFTGAGNVVEEAKKSVVKRKTKPKRHAKKKRKGRKARRSRTGRASRKGGK